MWLKAPLPHCQGARCSDAPPADTAVHLRSSCSCSPVLSSDHRFGPGIADSKREDARHQEKPALRLVPSARALTKWPPLHMESAARPGLRSSFVPNLHRRRPVKSCCFSPDGSLFASSSHDCTVRIWRLDTVDCLHVLTDHSKSVETVVSAQMAHVYCLLDGIVLSSCGKCRGMQNQKQHLLPEQTSYTEETGQKCKTFVGHQDAIQCCAFSTDGSRFATGSWDYTVRVWSLHNDASDRTLKGHTGNINCVCFSVSGMLASGSWDKTIRVWNPSRGALIFLLKGHVDWLRTLSFSRDGILLASTGHDKTVRAMTSG
ncbi:unnamed protein product [Ranitomeya imitator]|uniref:WD repeat-containing protein 38 n=1 Tax=Ranitomeya imitator TaxID=111125 RepID=A0ABN9MGC8_9NEOB|nr:unnamed protein product [Ranitomeya imitator]